MSSTLRLPTPDDWHLHVRDGEMLRLVLPHTARQFDRAIIMPNLRPPVTTSALAAAYRERILAALPAGSRFTPLMTAYLTDQIDAEDLALGFREGIFTAAKLYPQGATTNSDSGVSRIERIYPVLERMEREGMPLLIHGEVTDPAVDVFDRERVFVETVLAPLLERFAGLRVVLEHVTTADAAEFVANGPQRLAATVTAHHLLCNRNDLFRGGIRPHYYCLPVLKRDTHQQALRRIVGSGHPRFFLGTDSAPHARHTKEHSCGCAGCYTALSALELYAEAFESMGALDKLAAFASENGPRFYGLPVNPGFVVLRKEETVLPEELEVPGTAQTLVPFRAGERLSWQFQGRV